MTRGNGLEEQRREIAAPGPGKKKKAVGSVSEAPFPCAVVPLPLSRGHELRFNDTENIAKYRNIVTQNRQRNGNARD